MGASGSPRTLRFGSLRLPAGIDFALTVAADLAGASFAQSLQLQIEYAPAPPFDAGRPETAPREVLAQVQARLATLLPARWAGAEAAAARLAQTA